MGYSGLIYAAIVAAWAAFLVPRWVRRHEEIEQAAETDAARGIRVLQRRPAGIRRGHSARAGHSGTVLHGSSQGLVIGAAERTEPVSSSSRGVEPAPAAGNGGTSTAGASAAAGADPVAAIDATFAQAARRRRRLLVVLMVFLVVVTVASVAGWVSVIAPSVVGAVVLAFLFVARRAAVAQAVRRRAAVRRVNALAVRLADEFDEDVADEVELTADGKRVAVFEPPEVPEIDPEAWEPVAVPRPTYLDKAAAPPQPARSIDLRSSGAWTSGRLDPAGSIELPPQRHHPVATTSEAQPERPVEREDSYPEHRRAVGD